MKKMKVELLLWCHYFTRKLEFVSNIFSMIAHTINEVFNQSYHRKKDLRIKSNQINNNYIYLGTGNI